MIISADINNSNALCRNILGNTSKPFPLYLTSSCYMTIIGESFTIVIFLSSQTQYYTTFLSFPYYPVWPYNHILEHKQQWDTELPGLDQEPSCVLLCSFFTHVLTPCRGWEALEDGRSVTIMGPTFSHRRPAVKYLYLTTVWARNKFLLCEKIKGSYQESVKWV